MSGANDTLDADSVRPESLASQIPSTGYANYVLAVLVGAYILNYIDRLIIAILLEPIKNDLGVSDTAMGLLTGFAFSIFYALFAIPIARLADQHSRRDILAAGIGLWSLMTALCGFAQNYAQLLLARMGVGVGEAAGVAPSHSLISDYFAPARRARAFGIYSSAIYLGVTCGLVLGGVLTHLFSWRVAFVVVGLPGLIVALIVRLTVREPVRGCFDASQGEVAQSLPVVMRFIRGQRAYLYLAIGLSFVAVSSNAFNVWVPAFLGRVHAIGIAQIGISLGVLKGAFGVVGALCGGWLADQMSRQDVTWHLRIPAIVNFAGAFLLVLFVFAHELIVAFALYAAGTVLVGMTFGPVFALAQNLTPARMRAVAASIVLALTTLFGQGGGPFMVGALNDVIGVAKGPEAVRFSLAIAAAANLIAAGFFWRGSKHIREDLARLR
jgi:MFS family permease